MYIIFHFLLVRPRYLPKLQRALQPNLVLKQHGKQHRITLPLTYNIFNPYEPIYGIQASQGVYYPDPPGFDDNTIPSNLIVASSVFAGLFIATITRMGLWVYMRRDHPVVKFAQPTFLYLVLLGCLVGICAVFPLAISEKHISARDAYRLGVDGI